MNTLSQVGRLAAGSILFGCLITGCAKQPAAVPPAAVAVAAPPAVANDSADLVLENGDVHTPKGSVQAMAVSRGVIVALGDAASVQPLKGAGTKVIDLQGATVFPGLHDLHVHAIGSGQMQQQCTFPQGSSPQVVLDTVKACVAKRKPGEWISGGQWDAGSFGDTPIHKSLLDQVAPDNPVALIDISVHSVWLNSAALKAAGITRDTKTPEGGVIERDADGEPTGVLREAARGLTQGHVPPPTIEQNMEALKWAQQQMLRYGVTSFTDAGMGEDGLQVFARLADAGELKLRTRGCIAWGPMIGAGQRSDPIARRNLYARDRFKPDCVKMVLDGVPTEGHTAAMVEPYIDASGDPARARGILMTPANLLNAAVTDLDARGITVKMHAAGDGAGARGARCDRRGPQGERVHRAVPQRQPQQLHPEERPRASGGDAGDVRDVAVHLVPEPHHPGDRQGDRAGADEALDPGEGRVRLWRAGRARFRLGGGPFGESVDRDRNTGDAPSAGRPGRAVGRAGEDHARAGRPDVHGQFRAPDGQPRQDRVRSRRECWRTWS